ncbi:hypothetical protein CGMCC3_g17101 [Colletotrichum fructicola]|uniref:Uncharacterized protein n=1 Tax=Colletotrichum fructicola (strain Nara gc5) TaxID=1213859 RepID=L2FU83_COLFN|nr:uncharacterized protein CGMCC3_g17101 [Colletotrichum fructicola]KAE9566755.1 hypothetical protein CGMCC3_g17101 [Colletotrichum fructicola]
MSGNQEISAEAAAKLLEQGLKNFSLFNREVKVEGEFLEKLEQEGHLSSDTMQKLKDKAKQDGSAFVVEVPDEAFRKTIRDIGVVCMILNHIGGIWYIMRQ